METQIQDQGRGMLIYLKKHLSYKLLSAEDMVEDVEEAQLITLKMMGGETVTVCSIYRSPNQFYQGK
jgi:hypothetical protein